MKIYLDFDGTVVDHKFPLIGETHPLAQQIIVELIASGHEVVINTMRADFGPKHLDPALCHLRKLLGTNLPYLDKKIEPPKWDIKEAIKNEILFIDDHADEMPMVKLFAGQRRYMVDWEVMYEDLIHHKIIKK